MNPLLRNLGLGAIALTLGAAPARADDAAGESVTYARDIAPVVYSQCAMCHRPGQIGPMSLMSYEETRPWAKSIAKAVDARSMPPWHADPQYGKFENENRLTDEQIAMFVRWVDAGAPAGDLAAAPAPPEFNEDGWMIGEPDDIYMMEPYDIPDDIEDEYRHFVVETNLPEERSISKLEIRAGKVDSVHHVLVFVLPENSDAKSVFGPAMMKSTFLTGWAPGTNPLEYDGGFGKSLPAGAKLLFQLHYHKEPGPGTGGRDQSMMGVKWATTPIEHPTTTAWVMDPTIAIPPGAKDYVSVSSFKFIDDGWVLGMVPHMHLRGKSFTFTAQYPDGSEEILLHVPKYDFNWQTAYELLEPKEIPKGSTIVAEAHYDNSTDNPYNPGPDQTVFFGEATTDEMMIGFMEYAYKTRKSMQARFGMPEKLSGMGGLGGLQSRMEEKMKDIGSRDPRG